AAPIPASRPAPLLVMPSRSIFQPPRVMSTVLPESRKTVAGLGTRMSKGAPTVRKVSSRTPPYSMATAPTLTQKPSSSTDDVRPPTPSRLSTSSVRRPAWARRAAAHRPPAPEPITTASNDRCSLMGCSSTGEGGTAVFQEGGHALPDVGFGGAGGHRGALGGEVGDVLLARRDQQPLHPAV